MCASPGDSHRSRAAGGDAASAGRLRDWDAEIAAVADDDDADELLLPDRLCQALARILALDGVGMSMYVGRDIAVPIGASDPDAGRGEAIQFTVREGPCLEAHTTRRPVLVADVHDPRSPAWSHWPTYAEQLTAQTDYRGVFAFPLLAGSAPIASLGVYRRACGYPETFTDLRVLVPRIAGCLKGAILRGPDRGPVEQWVAGPTSQRRHLVWQAQAFVLQANHLTPGQATDLLRAQAFTAGRTLDDLAADIVSGHLPVPVLRPHP
jgi:hypothetical protein